MNRLVEKNQATFTIDQSEVKPEPSRFPGNMFVFSIEFLLAPCHH